MEYYALVITFLFICILVWALVKAKKTNTAAELKELVAWVVSPKDDIRWHIPLWAHIKDAQLHSNIPDAYRIYWEVEKEYVNDIIRVFQKDLIDSFFIGTITHKKTNKLTLPKPTAKYTDFFLYHLFRFLSEHRFDSHLLGHDVWEKQISYQSHGMWGRPLYDAVYEFSAFGRTVQKLYYVTYLACKASEIYKDNIAGWLTPEYFTEDLDSNQAHISQW